VPDSLKLSALHDCSAVAAFMKTVATFVNMRKCQPSGERVLPCNAKRVTGLKTANWRCENFGIYLCAGGQPHCALSKHVGSLAAGSADVALIWTMKICASSHFTGRSFGEYAFYEFI
ncbi:MAG: hypothetical protein WB610_00160, partial [Rhodomicrobium sp.]